jgi:hypothetical protein
VVCCEVLSWRQRENIRLEYDCIRCQRFGGACYLSLQGSSRRLKGRLFKIFWRWRPAAPKRGYLIIPIRLQSVSSFNTGLFSSKLCNNLRSHTTLRKPEPDFRAEYFVNTCGNLKSSPVLFCFLIYRIFKSLLLQAHVKRFPWPPNKTQIPQCLASSCNDRHYVRGWRSVINKLGRQLMWCGWTPESVSAGEYDACLIDETISSLRVDTQNYTHYKRNYCSDLEN